MIWVSFRRRSGAISISEVQPGGSVITQNPPHLAEDLDHRGDVFFGRPLESDLAIDSDRAAPAFSTEHIARCPTLLPVGPDSTADGRANRLRPHPPIGPFHSLGGPSKGARSPRTGLSRRAGESTVRPPLESFPLLRAVEAETADALVLAVNPVLAMLVGDDVSAASTAADHDSHRLLCRPEFKPCGFYAGS